MKELALKYGCNPNQKPSRIYVLNLFSITAVKIVGSRCEHQYQKYKLYAEKVPE